MELLVQSFILNCHSPIFCIYYILYFICLVNLFVLFVYVFPYIFYVLASLSVAFICKAKLWLKLCRQFRYIYIYIFYRNVYLVYQNM